MAPFRTMTLLAGVSYIPINFYEISQKCVKFNKILMISSIYWYEVLLHMTTVPINAITWSLGAAGLYTFSWKSWRSHQRTRNPLARMYYILGLTFGTGLFFFGVPGLITLNLHVLRTTYFMADLFVQVSLQVALWILWFLGLRNRLRLGAIYLVTVPYSLALMILQGLTSHVAISQTPFLIDYADKPAVLIMKSIIYMAVAMPIGYFLIRQVPLQTSSRAKLKALMGGMTFIVVGLAATYNNVFDRGSDTASSATVVAGFFIIFLLVQLLRPTRGPNPGPNPGPSQS